jgi:hypothetical protein
MNPGYYISKITGYEMKSFGSILAWDQDICLRHKFKIESRDYSVDIRAAVSKVIPVARRAGPYDSETSRIPHFLDN